MSRSNAWLFLALFVPSMMMLITHEQSHAVFSYDRHTPFSLVQLITTHLTHVDWQHGLKNLMALFILLVLFPANNRSLLAAFALTIMVTGSWVFMQGIEQFLGMSALLYCIPGLALAAAWQQRNLTEFYLIIGVFITYQAHHWIEHVLHGHSNIFMAAHWFGFLCGFLIQCTKRDQLECNAITENKQNTHPQFGIHTAADNPSNTCQQQQK